MKLEPREHNISENYLIQFADQLKLGKFYLGWGKDSRRRRRRRGKSTHTSRPQKDEKPQKQKRKNAEAPKDRTRYSKKLAVGKVRRERRGARSQAESSSSTQTEKIAGKKPGTTTARTTDTTKKETLLLLKRRTPQRERTRRAPKSLTNTKKVDSMGSIPPPPQPPLPTKVAPLLPEKLLVNPTIRLISGEKYQFRAPNDTPLHEFKAMLRRLKDLKADETTDPSIATHSMLLVMNGVVLEGGSEALLKDFNITDNSVIYLFP